MSSHIETHVEFGTEKCTPDGHNNIIASVIDKLGEITHSCGKIFSISMDIKWETGETYLTHLNVADSTDKLVSVNTIDSIRNSFAGWAYRYATNNCRKRGFDKEDIEDFLNAFTDWFGAALDIRIERVIGISTFNHLMDMLGSGINLKWMGSDHERMILETCESVLGDDLVLDAIRRVLKHNQIYKTDHVDYTKIHLDLVGTISGKMAAGDITGTDYADWYASTSIILDTANAGFISKDDFIVLMEESVMKWNGDGKIVIGAFEDQKNDSNVTPNEQEKTLTQRTVNIIMCTKGRCELPRVVGDNDQSMLHSVAIYMSHECACPVEDYKGALMNQIMITAFYDFMRCADRPDCEIRSFFNQITTQDREITLCERIATVFSLAQIYDDGKKCINGFTEKTLHQSMIDLGEIKEEKK